MCSGPAGPMDITIPTWGVGSWLCAAKWSPALALFITSHNLQLTCNMEFNNVKKYLLISKIIFNKSRLKKLPVLPLLHQLEDKVVLMALLKCSAGTCGGHEIVRSKTGNEGRAALNKLQTFGCI